MDEVEDRSEASEIWRLQPLFDRLFHDRETVEGPEITSAAAHAGLPPHVRRYLGDLGPDAYTRAELTGLVNARIRAWGRPLTTGRFPR